MKKIIKFIALSTIMISRLVYTENKQQITIDNKTKEDLSIQYTWRDKNPLHTRRLEDQTIEKNKTVVKKAPISSYRLEEIKAYYTKGINAAMNSSQKFHGHTYFVLTRGSRYKNDSGEKRHHIIIKGYKDKADYDTQMAAKNTANINLIQAAAGKNLLFSQCIDNSIATCDDETDITTLKCSSGSPDLNGMCSDGSLVKCKDETTPTCDDYSDPIKKNNSTPVQPALTSTPVPATQVSTPAATPKPTVPATQAPVSATISKSNTTAMPNNKAITTN